MTNTQSQAPEPLPEQYLGVEWNESESEVWAMSTREFLFCLVVGGGILAMFFYAWIGG